MALQTPGVQQNPTAQLMKNPVGVAQRPVASVPGGTMKTSQINAPAPGAQESYLARQKRLSPAPAQAKPNPWAAAATPTPATASGTSPVTADGKIAPAAPAAPANPWATAQPQAAPQAQPQAVAQPVPQPMPQPWTPPKGAPTWQGSQFDQFQANDEQGLGAEQIGFLKQLLANPLSMSQENVEQLKAQQREEAALMAQQGGMQASAAAAQRGTLGGGMSDLTGRRMNDSLAATVLGSNRDIAIQKMQQDQQDRLAASGAVTEGLNAAAARNQGNYQSQLAGQEAQAQDRQANNEFNYNTWNSKMQDTTQNRQIGVQEALGQGGLRMDQKQLDSQNRQFNLSHALNIRNFLEGQRQYNGNQGFNYAQLGQQGNNAMMDWLAKNYK